MLLSEGLMLAILAILATAVGKLWFDVKAAVAKHVDCEVRIAKVNARVEILEHTITSLQKPIGGSDEFVAMVVCDGKGIVLHWSPSAVVFFGYDPSEAVGRDVTELIVAPDLVETHHMAIRKVVEGTRSSLSHTLMHTRGRDRAGVEMGLNVRLHGWRPAGSGWVFVATFQLDCTQANLLP